MRHRQGNTSLVYEVPTYIPSITIAYLHRGIESLYGCIVQFSGTTCNAIHFQTQYVLITMVNFLGWKIFLCKGGKIEKGDDFRTYCIAID